MADFYDISEWSEKPWYQTGGTRSKVIVENPKNGREYYFKTSLKKEKLDYKYEHWSEIIASEIGAFLGFDMLKYDIAYKNGEVGCLCESMVTEGQNKLTEGVSYLTGFDTTYNPEDKSSKKLYTFHLIRDTFHFFKIDRFIDDIIKIIILDSIVGNGDRHQENWGIITEYNDIIKILEDIAAKSGKNIAEKFLFSILAITTKAKRRDVEKVAKNLHLIMPGRFSPIYDSGSCLGRELDDDRIKQMLTDNKMLESYIRKGVSEIHWEGVKLNHFELIKNVSTNYLETVKPIITKIAETYNEEEIRRIVESTDLSLPENLDKFKLPTERKEFIIKLITLRIQTLFNLI